MDKKSIGVYIICFSMLFLPLSINAKNSDTNLSYLNKKDIERIKNASMELDVKTDVKDLNISALQFSIFEADHTPLLQKSFKVSKKLNIDEGKKITQFDKSIDKKANWDFIFKNITEDNVYLIESKTVKFDGSSIMDNTPRGKKWLITKVTPKKDAHFKCWIIPFDAKIVSRIKVNIDDKNEVYLDGMYNDTY